MTALLALAGRFWYLFVIAGLFAYGQWWHHEAKDIAKDFAVYKSDVVATGERAKAKALQDKIDRDKITREEELKHAKEDADRDARYAGVLASLRAAQSKGNASAGAAKSISDAPSVCNDAARDARFSDAFSRYRQGVLGLLQACEAQTGRLVTLQEWARAQQAVK